MGSANTWSVVPAATTSDWDGYPPTRHEILVLPPPTIRTSIRASRSGAQLREGLGCWASRQQSSRWRSWRWRNSSMVNMHLPVRDSYMHKPRQRSSPPIWLPRHSCRNWIVACPCTNSPRNGGGHRVLEAILYVATISRISCDLIVAPGAQRGDSPTWAKQLGGGSRAAAAVRCVACSANG